MKIKSAGLTLAAVTLAVAGLAACGGSDNDNDVSSSTPSTADSFLAQVAAIVATSSDTTEPVSIEAIVATSPENTEPSAVM